MGIEEKFLSILYSETVGKKNKIEKTVVGGQEKNTEIIRKRRREQSKKGEGRDPKGEISCFSHWI